MEGGCHEIIFDTSDGAMRFFGGNKMGHEKKQGFGGKSLTVLNNKHRGVCDRLMCIIQKNIETNDQLRNYTARE